jgi:hypothetical protein
MKNQRLLISLFFSTVLLFACASMSFATANETGFYLGVECGEAALNNDLYLYSDAATARQPELNIKESNHWDGPAYSLYAGYNFISHPVNLFGQKPTLLLGFQGGYTDLGKYTVQVNWSGPNEGYRETKENSVDLLLSSILIWENGLNLSGKVGIARLSGKYTDVNLPDVRQPEAPFNGKADIIVYRPEIAVGVGYLIHQKVNIYLQYYTILGDTPDVSGTRFSDGILIDMPNTVYKADRLTLGFAYLF